MSEYDNTYIKWRRDFDRKFAPHKLLDQNWEDEEVYNKPKSLYFNLVRYLPFEGEWVTDDGDFEEWWVYLQQHNPHYNYLEDSIAEFISGFFGLMPTRDEINLKIEQMVEFLHLIKNNQLGLDLDLIFDKVHAELTEEIIK
jgi:hypothetical protein